MKLPALFVLGLLAACAGRRQEPRTSFPSSSVLTSEDIAQHPNMSLEELLMARIPGIKVMRAPDGHLAISFRGFSSFRTDQEALVVLNGIPLDPQATGNLSAINPREVEMIQVLKDGAATSMYGARGAFGVILIKTKQS